MRRHRKLAWATAALFLGGGAALFLAWPYRHLVSAEQAARVIEAVANVGPWAFFGAMALLPLFWFPASPFLLASPAFGTQIAIFGSIAALTVNMTVAWLVSSRWFRPYCERLVARFGYAPPVMSAGGRIGAAVLLRITPGVPFPLQNYLLGLAGMPLASYLLVSVPINACTSIGLILFGEAILRGNAGLGLLAVSVLLLVSLLARAARLRFKRRALERSLDGLA